MNELRIANYELPKDAVLVKRSLPRHSFCEKSMEARDMTSIIKRYPGYFVALGHEGYTHEEALEEANKKGYKEPILTKIPNEADSSLSLCQEEGD